LDTASVKSDTILCSCVKGQSRVASQSLATKYPITDAHDHTILE